MRDDRQHPAEMVGAYTDPVEHINASLSEKSDSEKESTDNE